MRDINIKRLDDPITHEFEGLITIHKPRYSWIKFKYLQLKEITRNVWSNISKRLHQRRYISW